MVIVRIDIDNPLYKKAKQLRNAVLRHPLGLVLTPEELALDPDREHFVALLNDKVVGSVSCYLETPSVLRVKQMAVDPECQGRGVGAKLLQAAESRGRELGAASVLLHARCTAQDFYDKQGYQIQGGEFAEQGIPHVIMVKRMQKSLA